MISRSIVRTLPVAPAEILHSSAPQPLCRETISGVSQSICNLSSELAKIFSKSERLSTCYLWRKNPQPQNPKKNVGYRPEDFFFRTSFQET